MMYQSTGKTPRHRGGRLEKLEPRRVKAWTLTTMPLSAAEYDKLTPEEQKAYDESERKREREEQAGQPPWPPNYLDLTRRWPFQRSPTPGTRS
jgi:hypothetical protein